MNAFAATRLDQAIAGIDQAVRLLGDYLDTRIPRDVLLKARGDLVAMRQLLELEADLLEKADTERPSHLRAVK